MPFQLVCVVLREMLAVFTAAPMPNSDFPEVA